MCDITIPIVIKTGAVLTKQSVLMDAKPSCYKITIVYLLR